MLGKICKRQGNTKKAIDLCEKFLDLWKDADPGIAEVEYVRKRLAGLKNHLTTCREINYFTTLMTYPEENKWMALGITKARDN